MNPDPLWPQVAAPPPPQYSPDGQWWWDGTSWQAVAPLPPPPVPRQFQPDGQSSSQQVSEPAADRGLEDFQSEVDTTGDWPFTISEIAGWLRERLTYVLAGAVALLIGAMVISVTSSGGAGRSACDEAHAAESAARSAGNAAEQFEHLETLGYWSELCAEERMREQMENTPAYQLD